MLKKLLFVYVFLFSYSGAILHSIIPHHHHNSHKEAKSHHHHENQSSHSHDDDQNDTNEHEQSTSFYFLTHAANADVLTTHADKQVINKGQQVEKSIAFYIPLSVAELTPSQKVFHPPSDDPFSDSTLYLFGSLRAPPISIC